MRLRGIDWEPNPSHAGRSSGKNRSHRTDHGSGREGPARLVGIDIGFGISMIKLKQKKTELQKLDKVIREKIPSGFQIRKEPYHSGGDFDFGLKCRAYVWEEKALLSLGMLGGGNHFIEFDQDEEGNLCAVIHSGSRHPGKEVAEYYLQEGQKELKRRGAEVPYEMIWLDDGMKDDYLHDLQIVQKFALWNRRIILQVLVKNMKWKITEERFFGKVQFPPKRERLSSYQSICGMASFWERDWAMKAGIVLRPMVLDGLGAGRA